MASSAASPASHQLDGSVLSAVPQGDRRHVVFQVQPQGVARVSDARPEPDC
jgi:hypothetical protein